MCVRGCTASSASRPDRKSTNAARTQQRWLGHHPTLLVFSAIHVVQPPFTAHPAAACKAAAPALAGSGMLRQPQATAGAPHGQLVGLVLVLVQGWVLGPAAAAVREDEGTK